MEDSRRTYESATERLVMFLEQVTTMLQATSPSQRKFVESTRAEVSKIAKRAKMQNSKRFSLDSSSMFRAESMPGIVFAKIYFPSQFFYNLFFLSRIKFKPRFVVWGGHAKWKLPWIVVVSEHERERW